MLFRTPSQEFQPLTCLHTYSEDAFAPTLHTDEEPLSSFHVPNNHHPGDQFWVVQWSYRRHCGGCFYRSSSSHSSICLPLVSQATESKLGRRDAALSRQPQAWRYVCSTSTSLGLQSTVRHTHKAALHRKGHMVPTLLSTPYSQGTAGNDARSHNNQVRMRSHKRTPHQSVLTSRALLRVTLCPVPQAQHLKKA